MPERMTSKMIETLNVLLTEELLGLWCEILTRTYPSSLGRSSVLKMWPLELQLFRLSIYLLSWLVIRAAILLTAWSVRRASARCPAPSMLTATPVRTAVFRP